MEHPQILGLNLKTEIVEHLKEKGYSIYDGNVGYITNLNLVFNQTARCLLHDDTPDNLHEFEIVILDLTNDATIDFIPEEHKRKFNKTSNNAYFECDYPQTIFDPRAVALSFLNSSISSLLSNNFLLIVFCAEDEIIEYHYRDENGINRYDISLYSFIGSHLPSHKNQHGKFTSVYQDDNELYKFFEKYNSEMTYDIKFEHPTIYKGGTYVNDPAFYPLIYNKQQEIVSFIQMITSNSGIICLPNLVDKKAFLLEFLDEIAPSIFPALFPENVKNDWKNYQAYALPNQERLVGELHILKKEYEQKFIEKEAEITANSEKYSFLHKMLTETDTQLVKAVIEYFEWLGFENVIDGDQANSGSIKEEDIQIETDKGLLIFEVKGIGSTSKDSDCRQIGKVKYRRAKQRNNFDVSAAYIVNHQRHLPPLDRKNPPFTDAQVQDAINEERALFTTWQLFNLYFDIEDGIFTKEQIRDALYNIGYIDFIPKTYLKIGTVEKFYKDNTVAIITLPTEVTIMVNDKVLIEDNGTFKQLIVESIKVEDQSVKSAKGVEVGILFSEPVPRKGCLYKIA